MLPQLTNSISIIIDVVNENANGEVIENAHYCCLDGTRGVQVIDFERQKISQAMHIGHSESEFEHSDLLAIK